MVGLGMLMILTGLFAAVLHFKKRLFETRWFHIWCVALTPSGFIAVLAGWFVTEIGRQPYIVSDVMRTAEAVSPVGGIQVGLSLLAFVAVYLLVFGAGVYYIIGLIRKGPDVETSEKGDGRNQGRPALVGRLASE
jgi:cytochrome d ubiquinol oxidase subunit I